MSGISARPTSQHANPVRSMEIAFDNAGKVTAKKTNIRSIPQTMKVLNWAKNELSSKDFTGQKAETYEKYLGSISKIIEHMDTVYHSKGRISRIGMDVLGFSSIRKKLVDIEKNVTLESLKMQTQSLAPLKLTDEEKQEIVNMKPVDKKDVDYFLEQIAIDTDKYNSDVQKRRAEGLQEQKEITVKPLPPQFEIDQKRNSIFAVRDPQKGLDKNSIPVNNRGKAEEIIEAILTNKNFISDSCKSEADKKWETPILLCTSQTSLNACFGLIKQKFGPILVNKEMKLFEADTPRISLEINRSEGEAITDVLVSLNTTLDVTSLDGTDPLVKDFVTVHLSYTLKMKEDKPELATTDFSYQIKYLDEMKEELQLKQELEFQNNRIKV